MWDLVVSVHDHYLSFYFSQRSGLIRVYTVCNSGCIFWVHYSLVKPSCSNFRVIKANFGMSEYLGFLR